MVSLDSRNPFVTQLGNNARRPDGGRGSLYTAQPNAAVGALHPVLDDTRFVAVPRCGAHCRTTGQPCRGPAMQPSGRCRMHRGGARRGREHYRFRTGERTREAIEAHAQAKALQQQAVDLVLATGRQESEIRRQVFAGKLTMEQAIAAEEAFAAALGRGRRSACTCDCLRDVLD
jgi:hypothetical protein